MTKNEVDLGLTVMVDFEKAFDTVSWDIFYIKHESFSSLDLPLKSISNYYILPQNAVSRIMGFTWNSSLLVEV